MEIRKNNTGKNDDLNVDSDRLEGFATAEMADRGPKDVMQDRKRFDTDAAAQSPVSNTNEEEGDEDYDDEDDDLKDDDVDLDDEVEEAAADADDAVITEDVDLDEDDLEDVDLDEEDDEEEDSI
jgi:ribonuclease E